MYQIRTMLAALAVLVAVALGVASGNLPKKDTHAAVNPNQKAEVQIMPQNTLIFFMNPNGRPCQVQLSALDGIKDKVAPLATVRYVKTTVDADYDVFAKYGIRSLPALMIVDKEGKEIKRFTPGIQSEDAILSALNAANGPAR